MGFLAILALSALSLHRPEKFCETQKDCEHGLICVKHWPIPDYGEIRNTCELPCDTDSDCVLSHNTPACLKAYFHLKQTQKHPDCSCPAGTSFKRCVKNPKGEKFCGMASTFQNYGLPHCAEN